MFDMENFRAMVSKPTPIDTAGLIPDSMDIWQRTETDFLPEGKTFEDLTPEELKTLKQRYKYDYYRPGTYQGITGIKNGHGKGSMM